MRELANQRHERFAQEIAAGETADTAYEKAGYRRDRHHAARLATNGHIRVRVAYLQGNAARNAVITLESLLTEEARVAAMAAGQYSAAIAAIKEIGILSGLRVEKREQRRTVSAEEISDDELAAIIRAGHPDAVERPH